MMFKKTLAIILNQIICQYVIAYSSCPDCNAKLKEDGWCDTVDCRFPIRQNNEFAASNLLLPPVKQYPRTIPDETVAEPESLPLSPLSTSPSSPQQGSDPCFFILGEKNQKFSTSFEPESSQITMTENTRALLVKKLKKAVTLYGRQLEYPESDCGEMARLCRLQQAFNQFRNEKLISGTLSSSNHIQTEASNDFMEFIDSHGNDHQLELTSRDIGFWVPYILHAHLCQGRGSVLQLILKNTITLNISFLPGEQQNIDSKLNTVLVTLSISGVYEIPTEKIFSLLKALISIESDIEYITALNCSDHNLYRK